MPLTIIQYEEIVALLHDVPKLVDELEARHAGLYDDVLTWMRRAEKVLENNRLPSCSQVATYRAQLIEAGRGVYQPGLHFIGRPTLRKIKEASAALVMGGVNDVLQGAIADRQRVFEEAQRIAQQLVAVAHTKGLPGTSSAFASGGPQMLRDAIAFDSDISSGYTHLVGLIGSADALLLLDRALPVVA
jgi:hypothetical protein